MRRRLPAFLLLGLLVLVSVSSWLLPAQRESTPHDVLSKSDDGRQGLLRLLQSFGFDAQRWEQRPGGLPVRPGLVWLARLPEGVEPLTPETGEEQADPTVGAAPLRAALSRSLSNPRHYRRFAAQGGSVLAEVTEQAQLARLAADFGFFEVEPLHLEPRPEAPDARDARLACQWISGETLEVSAPQSLAIEGVDFIPYGEVLLEDGDGAALIVELPVGRGSLLLCSAGSIFDNVELSRHDHAVVGMRLAESASHGGPIRLDESSGLGKDAPSLLDLALRPRARAFTLSLLALGVLFVWRSFLAREIPRDPWGVEFMSPRMRAMARARLFQRARRFDLLAAQLRRGTASRVAESTRLAPSIVAEATQSAEGARHFARAIGAGEDEERWVKALATQPVRGAGDLIVLDRGLLELEDQLESPARRAPRRRRG